MVAGHLQEKKCYYYMFSKLSSADAMVKGLSGALEAIS